MKIGVDWTDRIRHEGRWRYAVWCPRCQFKRYLPNYHAEGATYCLRCSNSEKGRTYQLANPSGPERRMIRQLDKIGISYERQVRCLWYNIDFVLGKTHAIEVYGGRIHTDLRDPNKEATRLMHIREQFKLLILTDSQTHNCIRVVREFYLS